MQNKRCWMVLSKRKTTIGFKMGKQDSPRECFVTIMRRRFVKSDFALKSDFAPSCWFKYEKCLTWRKFVQCPRIVIDPVE